MSKDQKKLGDVSLKKGKKREIGKREKVVRSSGRSKKGVGGGRINKRVADREPLVDTTQAEERASKRTYKGSASFLYLRRLRRLIPPPAALKVDGR